VIGNIRVDKDGGDVVYVRLAILVAHVVGQVHLVGGNVGLVNDVVLHVPTERDRTSVVSRALIGVL
jgi:hypothetical protein